MNSNTNIGIESPVPSLLISNDEPNVQQIKWIREITVLAEFYLETQSRCLDTVEARTRHAALASFLHTHKALLSPVRRVPTEIWDLIFRITVSDTNLENMESIRLIGNVCRLWYTIVDSIPEFSGILPPLSFQNNVLGAVFTETVPSRIFSNPHSTTYFGHFPNLIMGVTHPKPLLKLLSYVSRWKSLSIVLDPRAIWDDKNFLGSVLDTSHLDQLRVYVQPIHRTHKLIPNRPASSCDTFKNCNALRKIELDYIPSVTMELPWDKLTSYKERSHGKPIALECLLHGNTDLEYLEYRTSQPHIPVGRNTVDRIPFHRLRHVDIRIYQDSPSFPFTLLDKIITPSIQTLKVRDKADNFIPILINFISASGCGSTLTVLAMDTCPIEPGELIEVIRLTLMLITLECNNISLTDIYLLSMHTGRGKEATLVPFLRNLIVHSSSHVKAIDNLAKDRVRIYQNAMKRPSPSSDSAPLTVKLVFSDHRRSKAAGECLFDASADVHSSRSKLSDMLSELDIQINEMKAGLFEKNSAPLHTIRRLLSNFSQSSPSLEDIFAYLESIPIETMPETMNWAIHVLKRFSVLNAFSIPFHYANNNFINRADNLVHSWKDLLKRQKISPTWMLHGRFGLLLIANISKSYNSLGTPAIEEDKDILWGEYDYSANTPVVEYIAWRRKVNFH